MWFVPSQMHVVTLLRGWSLWEVIRILRGLMTFLWEWVLTLMELDWFIAGCFKVRLPFVFFLFHVHLLLFHFPPWAELSQGPSWKLSRYRCHAPGPPSFHNHQPKQTSSPTCSVIATEYGQWQREVPVHFKDYWLHSRNWLTLIPVKLNWLCNSPVRMEVSEYQVINGVLTKIQLSSPTGSADASHWSFTLNA
jgi:hypothetical protein